jgi:hypothetical protein
VRSGVPYTGGAPYTAEQVAEMRREYREGAAAPTTAYVLGVLDADARHERWVAALDAVVDAAREATVDTSTIPACVRLGRALRAYDQARGAVCGTCDGAGTTDKDVEEPGDGTPCATCGGKGLVEPAAP